MQQERLNLTKIAVMQFKVTQDHTYIGGLWDSKPTRHNNVTMASWHYQLQNIANIVRFT